MKNRKIKRKDKKREKIINGKDNNNNEKLHQ